MDDVAESVAANLISTVSFTTVSSLHNGITAGSIVHPEHASWPGVSC